MKLVHFTAPDGGPEALNPDQVQDVRAPEKGMYDPRARAVIYLQNGFRAVRETPSEVEARLQNA